MGKEVSVVYEALCILEVLRIYRVFLLLEPV